MCLGYLTDRRAIPNRGIGWKVFRRYDGKYETANYGEEVFEEGEWVERDIVVDLSADDATTYQSGFHVFLTKQGARDWSHLEHRSHVRRVEYDGVVAAGVQMNHDCVVVERLRIVPDQESSDEVPSDGGED